MKRQVNLGYKPCFLGLNHSKNSHFPKAMRIPKNLKSHNLSWSGIRHPLSSHSFTWYGIHNPLSSHVCSFPSYLYHPASQKSFDMCIKIQKFCLIQFFYLVENGSPKQNLIITFYIMCQKNKDMWIWDQWPT